MNNSTDYKINRHDLSIDRSLKPYSAADEYLLETCKDLQIVPNTLAIYHDRFGYLTCHLNALNPTTVFTNKSQLNAIELNVTENNLTSPVFSNPISLLNTKVDFALMKVPKSLALFQLYLEHIAQNSTKEVTVVISFMTRHFTTSILQIAEKYFENVEQSRAVKKARTITLTNKKQVEKLNSIDTLNYNNNDYLQYWGVFSAKHIDFATQYFLEHIKLKPTDQIILDLASGNGVIAKEVSQKLPDAEIYLLDDAYLAVESAKLNIEGKNIHHHFSSDLSEFKDNTFDLIVTNPPFHFEYEINVKIPTQLFQDSFRCLKAGGNLQVVANKHLNYSTHLKVTFSNVEVIAQNDNFVIYKCEKTEKQ